MFVADFTRLLNFILYFQFAIFVAIVVIVLVTLMLSVNETIITSLNDPQFSLDLIHEAKLHEAFPQNICHHKNFVD